MKQRLTFAIILLLALAMNAQAGNDKLLDFYAEETTLFGASRTKIYSYSELCLQDTI